MTFHTAIFVGNLGRDPEMRYTPSGQAVTNFSLAVNDDYTNNNGERVKRTIWVRVSTWGKQAEIDLGGLGQVIAFMGEGGTIKPPLPAAERFVDLRYLAAAGVR